MDISLDGIADLLSSMNEADLDSLRQTAEALFGQGSTAAKESSGTDLGINPDVLFKATKIMEAMQSGNHARSGLIAALKPYLSAPRQKKAEEAMQVLRLLDVLPLLKDAAG